MFRYKAKGPKTQDFLRRLLVLLACIIVEFLSSLLSRPAGTQSKPAIRATR